MRISRVVIALTLAGVIGSTMACSSGNSGNDDGGTTQTTVAYTVPAGKIPSNLPTELTQITSAEDAEGYLHLLFGMLATHTKGSYHPMPKLVRIDNTAACSYFEERATVGDLTTDEPRGGAYQACVLNGEAVIAFGPKLAYADYVAAPDYRFWFTTTITALYRNYLILAQGKNDSMLGICTLGLIHGGLKDAKIITAEEAGMENILRGGDLTAYNKGQDTGKC